MPSPVGHALGGLAAGWLASGISTRAPVAGVASAAPSRVGALAARFGIDPYRAALFVLLGIAPDLDLLFGTHSTYTHSLGAVFIAGVAALTMARDAGLACGCAAAWASHVLLDWLGADSSVPYGVMALWPFSDAFHHSPVTIFMAVSRRYWLPGFVAHNVQAVARELLVLVPVMGVVWWLRKPER